MRAFLIHEPNGMLALGVASSATAMRVLCRWRERPDDRFRLIPAGRRSDATDLATVNAVWDALALEGR